MISPRVGVVHKPVYTRDIASLNVTRVRGTLPYYVQGFRTAVRIGGEGSILSLRFTPH